MIIRHQQNPARRLPSFSENQRLPHQTSPEEDGGAGLTYYTRPEDSTFGRLARHRLATQRDLKINISAISAQTGTGKSTVALALAEWIDPEFDADQHAFIDLLSWMEQYFEERPGGALIMDEIEQAMDRRRPMSGEIVDASHMLAMARFKQKVSIWTLPTLSMLDRRAINLSDVWIVVQKRGLAFPYYLYTKDNLNHNPYVYHVRFRDEYGNKERIRWRNLDHKPGMQTMAEMKQSLTDDFFKKDQEQKEFKEKVNQKSKRLALEVLCEMKAREFIDVSDQKIADFLGYGNTHVGKVRRSIKNNLEIGDKGASPPK